MSGHPLEQDGCRMTLATEQNSVLPRPATVSLAAPSDYVTLLKLRVMSLVVFTALAGLLIAPVHVHPVIGVAILIAIGVGAGAAGALNMWYDADIDAVMTRTRKRPIPAGAIEPGAALAFGLILAVLSVLMLGLLANWLAAALLAFTIFFYVAVYTMWLKRTTPQNIVIGGAAGSLPPIIGYAAATGDVSVASVALFMIIFFWTPPHFWALALLKSDDYARAGIPMMPNVKGADRTRLEILVYTLILVPIGLSPWFLGFGGLAYGVAACLSGAIMLRLAWRVYRRRQGEPAAQAARQLFAFSILYLFLLFAVVVAEHGLGLAARLGL
jgi:protoheme IX farnesyltransferase